MPKTKKITHKGKEMFFGDAIADPEINTLGLTYDCVTQRMKKRKEDFDTAISYEHLPATPGTARYSKEKNAYIPHNFEQLHPEVIKAMTAVPFIMADFDKAMNEYGRIGNQDPYAPHPQDARYKTYRVKSKRS